MKIVANTKLIRRNARIGVGLSILSLAILGGGFYLSLNSQDPNQFGLIWGALILGFVLSQIGIYYGNRWGRRPRPDEVLDEALKGLDDRYTFYHFSTPVSHLLVGPAGLWVLLPQHQLGKITYAKKRYRQKSGGCLQAYLRFFGQEGIGRPELEASNDMATMTKYLTNHLPNSQIPSIQSALVFINEKTELGDVSEAPMPTLLKGDVKEFIRKAAKDSPLTPLQQKEIQDLFEKK